MNLIIIDDDTLLRKSLVTILTKHNDVEVLGTGSDGSEALELYLEHKPDIVLMDIRMKNINGLKAAEAILNYDTNAKVLFLTTFVDDEYIQQSLRIGARGYLVKQDFETIKPALDALMNGQVVFGREIIPKLPFKKQFVSDDLTESEIHLIKRLSEGLTNKELALELFLSEGTIRNYLSIIMNKLSLRDRTQLVIYYYENIR